MDENRTPKHRIGPQRLLRRLGPIGLALALLILPGRALGASIVWDGGCEGDPSWSCAANWRKDVVPGPGDTVAFNRKSTGTAVVDPGFGGEVATLRLTAGFPGRVVLDRSLTLSKGFQQTDGEFAAGENALAAKAFMLKGGAFEASSDSTSVAGTLKISGTPEFDANGGTLVVEGTGGKLICGGVALNRVVFANEAGAKLVDSSCDLPLGANPIAGAGGSIKLRGTLSGSGALSSTGTLVLEGAGALAGFSALNADGLTVNGPYDFGAYSGLSVAGTFLLNGNGSFTAPAATASFGGTFKLAAAAGFDANGGAVVFDGTGNAALTCSNKSFNLVRFAHADGTKVVEKTCSLPLGSDPALGEGGGAAVRLNGTLSGAGTLAANGSLTMNRTAKLIGFGGLDALGDLSVVSATADFGSYSPFTISGGYSQAAGKVTAPADAGFRGSFALNPRAIFEAPSGTISVGGDFSVDPEATFNANGGAVAFDGEQSAVLSCGGAKFNFVAFSHVAGTKTVGSSCSLPLGSSPAAGKSSIALEGTLSGSGTLTTAGTLSLTGTGALSGFSGLAAQGLDVEGAYDFGAYSSFSVGGLFALRAGGSFTAPSGTASFAGDFLNEGGAFLANGGTVVLNGGNQLLSGSTTFNNLSKVAPEAQTLRFAAGDMQTIEGLLVLKGLSGQLLTLESTVPGTPWLLNTEDGAEVEFVSVTDSTNVGTPIVAIESKSKGGNSGWNVSGPAVKLVLGAQSTTPAAGAADSLTIVAKDANGNTASSYTGLHNLTFGPVADSPSGAHASVVNFAGGKSDFGEAAQIKFVSGVATASGGKNGVATLVKAGSTSLVVSDGSISNGAGLAMTVAPGAAARLAWSNPTSSGTLESPCLFTCSGKSLGKSGYFKANVSVTDGLGNRVSNLGSGHKVSVSAEHGSISGGSLTIASTGPAESTTQFTYTPSTGGAVGITAETSAGTAYTAATASVMR